MKFTISAFAVVVAALVAGTSLPTAAAPTLIGDTISIKRVYPDLSTQFGNAIPDTTVEAGTADVVGWSFGSNPVSVHFDPEADSIQLDVLTNTGFAGTNSVIDGFVVSGIDFDIESVSVLSNGTQFTVDAQVLDAHSLVINVGTGNVQFSQGTIRIGVQAHVDQTPLPGVPEPASVGLVGASLALLAIRARRNSRRDSFQGQLEQAGH